jgi:hypothetical protein
MKALSIILSFANSIFFLALLVPAMLSQTTAPPPALAFEVASIRLNPGPCHVMLGFSSSRPNLRLTAWYPKSLIMEAYDLREYEIAYSSLLKNDPPYGQPRQI